MLAHEVVVWTNFWMSTVGKAFSVDKMFWWTLPFMEFSQKSAKTIVPQNL